MNHSHHATQEVPTDFDTLTLRHLSSLKRFALSLTRDAPDADDLVQETYLRALQGWSTFRHGSDVRVWLFTICRNAFFRLYRPRRDTITMDDADAMPAVRSPAQSGTLVSERAAFDNVDVRSAIEHAINFLSESHHKVLFLVDLEGLSYDEAAVILGVPTSTVRSRLFRARRSVQDALSAHAEDAGLV